MILQNLTILNYKNIEEANLNFSQKMNCFIGNNAQGKTNVFNAIYLLSFTKSAFNNIDSQNIQHNKSMAWVEGIYYDEFSQNNLTVSCSIKTGQKKQFRINKKICHRMLDHIGTIPLVMISPEDDSLVQDGSEERRKFMDVVICQQNKAYLNTLMQYTGLLKQRNALLKKYDSNPTITDNDDLLTVLEEQMIPLNQTIYETRRQFIDSFVPFFQTIYGQITESSECVGLSYLSQMHNRDIKDAFASTRNRDKVLGWTSQGIHKDDLEMLLFDNDKPYLLKHTGSQGQQKTYIMAMKLAQATYLNKPILLLDDIFDKLDLQRVQNIIKLLNNDHFGQIFITDTNRQHLTHLLTNTENEIFYVNQGHISQ